jgi:hypothetical protein
MCVCVCVCVSVPFEIYTLMLQALCLFWVLDSSVAEDSILLGCTTQKTGIFKLGINGLSVENIPCVLYSCPSSTMLICLPYQVLRWEQHNAICNFWQFYAALFLMTLYISEGAQTF